MHGDRLRWVLSAFGFWLLVATRGLWLNQGDFPQVPWLAWGCSVPRSVDLCLLMCVCGALIGISVTGSESRTNRGSLLLFAGGLFGLLLLDQHRGQPWVYQLVLVAIVLALTPHRLAFKLLRLLTISIYVHSAISKCDASFCTGIGRSFLLTLSHLIPGPLPATDAWQTGAWPLLFPLGELLVAMGLIWPASRRWALWGACGMHLLLVVVLGPWGLNHSHGVLIWNFFWLVQNLILFSNPLPTVTISDAKSSAGTGAPNNVVADAGSIRHGANATKNVGTDAGSIRHVVTVIAAPGPINESPTRGMQFAKLLIAWAVLWPCLEPFGYCDLWPAWGLYAQHGEQITVRVSDRAWRQLPIRWQETATLTDQRQHGKPLWQLRPQNVSLQSVAAPLYPQNRFVLGVILALAREAGLPADEISATWFDPANRWTGARTSRHLTNLGEMQQAARDCCFNAFPRQ